LVEALTDPQAEAPMPVEQKLQAMCDLGFLSWNQYVKITRMGNTMYCEEGNGEARLK
jgi:hypothetical protein